MWDTLRLDVAGWRRGLLDAAARVLRLRRVRPRPAARAVFVRHYDTLRDLAARPDGNGFVVVAAGKRGIEGAKWLPATPGDIQSAVVGRHGCCDIAIPGADDLSLRHLALILHRRCQVSAIPGTTTRSKLWVLASIAPAPQSRLLSVTSGPITPSPLGIWSYRSSGKVKC